MPSETPTRTALLAVLAFTAVIAAGPASVTVAGQGTTDSATTGASVTTSGPYCLGGEPTGGWLQTGPAPGGALVVLNLTVTHDADERAVVSVRNGADGYVLAVETRSADAAITDCEAATTVVLTTRLPRDYGSLQVTVEGDPVERVGNATVPASRTITLD